MIYLEITTKTGIIGMMLNGFLIFNLAQTRMDKGVTVYHYACVISAISSFYTAFLVMIAVDVSAFIFTEIKSDRVYQCNLRSERLWTAL